MKVMEKGEFLDRRAPDQEVTKFDFQLFHPISWDKDELRPMPPVEAFRILMTS
jgi:hypothetical protein